MITFQDAHNMLSLVIILDNLDKVHIYNEIGNLHIDSKLAVHHAQIPVGSKLAIPLLDHMWLKK